MEDQASNSVYRIQPGTVDINHLELVALERVSKGSWMPHFQWVPDPTRPPHPKSQRHLWYESRLS